MEAVPLDARLKTPFRFGNVVRTRSANVLVRIVAEDGLVGYGEACPVPQLTADNPRQRMLIAEVKQLMTQQMSLQSSSIALAARAPDAAVAMFLQDRSYGIMRRLRTATNSMLEEENRLLPEAPKP